MQPAIQPQDLTQPVHSEGTLLALGVTLDTTTACLLENVSGLYRLVGWETLHRRIDASIPSQCAATCRQLGDKLGRPLWDDEQNRPWLQGEDPIGQPPLAYVTAGITPRPRLRVWLVGLTKGGSLAAARQALASAPLELVGMTTLTTDLQSGHWATKLIDAQPEVLVVVGGHDDADAEVQQWLNQMGRITGRALERMPPGQRPTVFYAGNRWAAEQMQQLLSVGEGPLRFVTLGNVLPAPMVVQSTELAVALSRHYWRLAQRIPGVEQLSSWITSPGRLVNLEASFAQLVQLWMDYQQLPVLHGLYCTPHWWLHVWAVQAQQGVVLRFVKPNFCPPELLTWPPVQVVSGAWPMALWPPPQRGWWDRSGMAPLVTTVGQVAPMALLQVLENDLLEPRHRRQANINIE